MSTETKTSAKLILPINFVTSPPIPVEGDCPDNETATAIRAFYLQFYARQIAEEIKRRRGQKPCYNPPKGGTNNGI